MHTPQLDRWALLGIAIGWTVIWIALYFINPRAFPWLGIPIGALLVALILIFSWIERRMGK